MKSLFNDRYRLGMTLLEFLLLASMIFKPDLKLDFFICFAAVSRALFPMVAVFFGNSGIWCFFFITSIVNVLDSSFDDFTALSVFCVLYLFIPKEKKWLKVVTVSTYVICVFLMAELHDHQSYHLFVHFIGCGLLILSVHKLKGELGKSCKLKLTNDERIILEELVKGKHQKEILQFSQNTVTNKLKQARLRNGISTTEELVELYRLSCMKE